MRASVVIAALFARAVVANADTYVVPPDFEVVCLDATSGAELWRTKPAALGYPALYLSRGKLVADGVAGNLTSNNAKRVRIELNPQSGAIESTREFKQNKRPKRRVDVDVATPMRSLVDGKGRRFVFKSGYTRDLEYDAPGGKKLVRELEWFPKFIAVAGTRAFLSFGDFGSGGEVYAFDFGSRRIAWEFHAHRHLQKLPESAYTFVTADAGHVYVSVDQVLFSLRPSDGKVLWKRPLPRQPIRRYDAGWTTIARLGDTLLVGVYERLFAVRERDGKLLWQYDAGTFGRPWPVVHGNKLYLAVRKGPVQKSSMSITSPRAPAKSALRIDRTGKDYRITTVSRRRIPRRAKVYWALSPPPMRSAGTGARTILRIHDFEGPRQLTFDLSQLLRGQTSTAYIKFTGVYNRATLTVGAGDVASLRWK